MHSSGAASAWAHGKLSTKLWTWNSGKTDLRAEAHALAQSDEDVLVTCQTEAKAHIKDAMPPSWKLVASAEHWGFAGGSQNAQMMGVFLKNPLRNMGGTGGVSTSQSSALGKFTSSWENTYRPSLGDWVSIRPSAALNGTAPILSARAMTIATDYKGKGGAAVTLILPATPFRKKTTITYICAHLDAQSEQGRSENLRLFWAAVRAPDTLEAWKTLVGDKKTILGKPMCTFFDGNQRHCALGTRPGTAEIDVLMIFGDLNFRIKAEGKKNEGMNIFKVADVTSYTGRRYLATADYLKAGGRNQMELTKSVASGNMGFECNQPYDIMPPSYKRIGAEDCTQLGKYLKLCGNPDQPECNADIKLMAVKCYIGEEGTADASFDTKGNDLQTGWLDRTCIRTVDTSGQNANLRIAFDVRKEKGWTEVPGKKDKVNGGDHMPVESTVNIWREGCLLAQLPAHSTHNYDARGQADTPFGKSFDVACENGRTFGASKVKVLKVVCAKDGKLRVWLAQKSKKWSTVAGSPIFERKCT